MRYFPRHWQSYQDALSNVQSFYPIHYLRILTKRVGRAETTCGYLPMLVSRRMSRERLTQNALSFEERPVHFVSQELP